MALGDVAARMPWPVFACDAEKRPCVATGFKAATRDVPTILRQFASPSAAMIGMPTGRVSGIIALDIDIKNGRTGTDWLDENGDALPPTRTHKTRSGGLHLLFRAPEGVEIRNSASRVAPGVDVRGEGGYIILPPSPGYSVADNAEPAEMPRWLIRTCMREEALTPAPRPQERHEKYTQAAIDGEVLAVMRAVEGTRNDTLNKAAVKLGSLVAAGQMARSTAEAELTRAAGMAGLDPRETAATIKSGLDFGVQHPREMPAPRMNGYHAEPPPVDLDDPGYWQSIETEAADAARGEPEDTPEVDTRPAQPFPATPLSAAELTAIPPREIVYGHFLFRKFISAIGAPGGAGKTAYAFGVALAVVTGRKLLGEDVHDPGAVWIYNLEDPRVELLRRVKAAMIGHDLSWADIDGKLYLDSGRERPLVIAKANAVGDLIAWPQVPDLIAEIKARGIRLLIVDPFVRSHRVRENYNDQIDFVAALWASIADQADCAILLVHHFNKGGISGEAAAFRGASALIDASRAAVTLAQMSADEATKMDIAEKDRWQYVRADNAKLNLAPPPDQAIWLRLTGIDLHNAAGQWKSDSVQTVKRWQPRRVSVSRDLSAAAINEVLDEIDRGPEPGVLFTATRRGGSGRWCGNILRHRHNFDDKQAAALINTWLQNGLLIEANYMHPEWRRLVPGVCVDNAKRPTP